MYGISTHTYHKNQPNVGKYTIHGSYGLFSEALLAATDNEISMRQRTVFMAAIPMSSTLRSRTNLCLNNS